MYKGVEGVEGSLRKETYTFTASISTTVTIYQTLTETPGGWCKPAYFST